MDKNRSEQMFALIDEQRQSGKSQKQFCRQHGINPATFSYWVRRKNQADRRAAGFLPVDVSGAGRQGVELTFPNGVRLSLPGADAALLTRLIKSF